MASEAGAWRSEALGEGKELRLGQGPLRYHDTGTGPPIVFTHGVIVNANLWRKVVPRLAPSFRCVALDLPLGAHLAAMPEGADLSPPALADLIADAIGALGLEDVTLVGNDTGGALCQLVAARRPERIGRLVLTSCDAFENFPPKSIAPLVRVMAAPGVIGAMGLPMRLRFARRRSASLLGVAKHGFDPDAGDSYALPMATSGAVRRDLRKVFKGIDNRYTLEAAERLREFDHPALVAWSADDRFFPKKDAKRLAETLPNARLEWIEDAYTLSPEDQPERLAELIAEFVREPVRAAS